eukprot:GHUV01017967.1.p1 GENE.GHUV01017967.1~~GHUV01017967.1.p1  ORF type:complete len:233 (+),score=46.39 GHUV01017967.1:257-955(+)
MAGQPRRRDVIAGSCTLGIWYSYLLVLAVVLSACTTEASSNRQSSTEASNRLSQQLTTRWLTNEQLAAWMTEYTHRCSNISRKFSIGSSSQGRKLWVLEISDKPGQQEPEPNFKYIANMHGDETSGRMLLPMLAEWLCDSWQGGDQRAARIVKDMHLYLMPTMNPGRIENPASIAAANLLMSSKVLVPCSSVCAIAVPRNVTLAHQDGSPAGVCRNSIPTAGKCSALDPAAT